MLTPIILAALFGACSFALLIIVLKQSLSLYRQYYNTYVRQGLKESFIFMDPILLFIVNIAAIVVLGAVAFFVLSSYNLSLGLGGMITVMIVTALIPTLMINRVRQRRIKQFIYQLPDALSALAAALRGGANLTRGLELLANQQPIPLSQEFNIVLAEYKVGRELEESLADLYKRIPRQELELMNSAMGISRSVGGNLADTLLALATSLRQKAEIEGKIEALTAMGRAQAWVIGLIPFLIAMVMFKQEPEGMKLLYTTQQGWITLAIITGMLISAVLVIRRIIDIDV